MAGIAFARFLLLFVSLESVRFITLAGLYDTVFDVDHDKERSQEQGLEPNGFNFDGADAGGVDYALNRYKFGICFPFVLPSDGIPLLLR